MNGQPRFTMLGKLISVVLVLGLVGLGVYMIRSRSGGGSSAPPTEAGGSGAAPEVTEVKVEVPRLSPPAAFQFKDNIVPIEISEYAGYAGLIAANGGLEPTENSLFFKNHGFKVRLTVSEDESWSEFNEGKMAASVTTVDVLAAYGKQLHAVVPAQIGFSRGADGIVVRGDIKRINQLKGKTIATAQFTEVDFFIRYLAQEAGLAINTLGSLDATPHPDRLNLVYTEDGFGAGDLFLNDIKSGKNKLAGCVTWEPKVSEVVDGSGGQAHVLVTNRNLLIIADVLIVHRGFAQEQPKIVEGLVQGLLEGNRMVRDRPDQYLDVIGRSFKWSRDDTKGELANVHLSNLPENLAFFSGAIDAAGSFESIYQSWHLQGPEGRDRSDPFGRRRVARDRSPAEQGHPVPVRGELLDTRPIEPGKPQESGGDQATAPDQPGVDAAAPRTRRQREGRRVPQAGRRGLRPRHGAARDGAQQGSRRRDSQAARREVRDRRQADRNRRPRVGRDRGPQLGSESSRRSAVVHARVN
jgi:ABC-type nitrate/sulfonate/bicarbonate transport system substrate-binding protein